MGGELWASPGARYVDVAERVRSKDGFRFAVEVLMFATPEALRRAAELGATTTPPDGG